MGLGLGLRHKIEAVAARRPAIRTMLVSGQILRARLFAGRRRHPLDRRYRIETQTHVPLYLLKVGSAADGHMIPYGGCVPSVLRHVLDAMPAIETASFVDLGCGKGRALAVASEYPFLAIRGIELNPALAAAARRNLGRIGAAFPERTPASVRVGDASVPMLGAGDAVVFMYHPFDAPLVERLAAHLANTVRGGQVIHLVYENPVHGDIFDGDPAYRRVSATMSRCTDDEAPFAFDASEAVAVWRLGGDAPDPAGAGGTIHVTKPGFRAVILD